MIVVVVRVIVVVVRVIVAVIVAVVVRVVVVRGIVVVTVEIYKLNVLSPTKTAARQQSLQEECLYTYD